ncbi:MAG: serine hydrolase domain-containing protein [Caldilineaceae bacterium]
MCSRKFLFPSLLFCALIALILRLFVRSASAKPANPNTPYDAIDVYIEQQLKRLNLPGASLAIIEGDQIVHLRGFGKARPDGDVPTPQTPFFIGSTTKSFTALAIMQLVEAGKVELDAPVQRYLPWFRVADPQASAQMTVRHLLNQTSGLPLLPSWQLLADFDDHPGATERQVRGLARLALSQPPGAAFEYSNLNYNVLGLIIEVASGEPYADYIQNHIFLALGMSHSYTSKAAAKEEGLAVGHQTWFGIPIAVPNLPVPSGSLPSGQLISSAGDMGHYLIMHLNEGRYGEAQLLSPAGIAELHRPAVDASSFGVREQYGMGWYIEEQGQTKLIWHSGMIPDFYTYMALLPKQKKGVVLLVNANHFMMQLTMTEVGAGMAALLAGNPPAPIQLGFIPWMVRSLLLIPLLQIVGVAATLWRLRRWYQDPQSRPSRGRMWGLHILLPLFPNLLLAALPIYLLSSKLLGFMLLFAADFSWTTLICGGFAGVWSFVRIGLILRVLRQNTEKRYSETVQATPV